MTNDPIADAINAGNKLKSSGVLDLNNLDAMDPNNAPPVQYVEIKLVDLGRGK